MFLIDHFYKVIKYGSIESKYFGNIITGTVSYFYPEEIFFVYKIENDSKYNFPIYSLVNISSFKPTRIVFNDYVNKNLHYYFKIIK